MSTQTTATTAITVAAVITITPTNRTITGFPYCLFRFLQLCKNPKIPKFNSSKKTLALKLVLLYNKIMNKHRQLIIDASCVMAVISDSDEREIVLKKAEGYEILSTECLPYEICNCISKMIKRNMISMEKGLDLFKQFESIDISYITPDFETTLKIAGEEKHYSYDAFYIENALRLGVPVLSLDKGLIAIKKKRGVTCL